MFYRAVSKYCCEVPGDPWKRKLFVDMARGPLVPEERQAEILKMFWDKFQFKQNLNLVQTVRYD